MLDFVFPKSEAINALEQLTPQEILQNIPRRTIEEHEDVLTLFDYRNATAKKLVWELKYRGNRTIAKLLGKIMYGELLSDLADRTQFEDFTAPLLIPIPISKSRRAERGFNQSELLAEAIILHDVPKYFSYDRNTLIKIKDTGSQTKTRNKKERQKNLKDCFALRDATAIRGRNIILIDDVLTTGSTIEEAKRTLLRGDARKVIAITVAH